MGPESPDKRNVAGRQPDDTPPTPPADRIWLSDLLGQFAAADEAGFLELLGANPALVAASGGDPRLRAIRDALTEADGPAASPAFRQAVAEALGVPRAAGLAGGTTKWPFGERAEVTGVLTDVTRSLPPERAMELYRSIAPQVIYEMLRAAGNMPRLEMVLSLAERMCSPEVQERLRASAHVRDGLIDELSAAIAGADLREQLDREAVKRILEECGAMRKIVAMANCIKLARSRAG